MAWVETSKAEVGSSSTMNLRLGGQRAGDGDALRLAAGDGAGQAFADFRVEADAAATVLQLARGSFSGSVLPARRIGSAMISPMLHARVQRFPRVLEHDLDTPALQPALGAA